MAPKQKIINRLNDALTKYVFARQEQKHVTLSLINSFFELEHTAQLMDFEFRDRELDPLRQSQKTSLLDIHGVCKDGTAVSVEIQVDKLDVMGKRSLFYWTRLYPRLMRGEDYTQLRRTVCINILDYELFPDEATPDYHNCFGVLNKRHPQHVLTDDMEIHFVEIPKWERNRPKDWKQMTHLERWLAYFSRKTTDEELEAMAMNDPMMQEALKAEHMFMLDPALISAYDEAENARRDQAARDSQVRNEGRMDIVLGMLREHQPIELIMRCSNFSEAEIREAGKRNGLL